MQDVAMLAFMDKRRIVDLHHVQLAMVVGERNEKLEALSRRQQRASLLRLAHGRDRVVHQRRHAGTVQRRLEPARTDKEGEVAADLLVLDGRNEAGGGCAPEEWLKRNLAPAPGTRFAG